MSEVQIRLRDTFQGRKNHRYQNARRLDAVQSGKPGWAASYYDFCTLLGVVYNTVNRSGLPKDRVEICTYEAGHMAYLGEDNAQKLSDDIRRFVLYRKAHA